MAYGIFLGKGSNLSVLHCQADSLPLSHQRSPYMRVLNSLHPHQYLVLFIFSIFAIFMGRKFYFIIVLIWISLITSKFEHFFTYSSLMTVNWLFLSFVYFRFVHVKCNLYANLLNDFSNLMIQFSSVTQSGLTLCDPLNCSTPGLPVHHQPPEFTQTHIHRVGDAIQPFHLLSSPSPPAINLSQHQGLFKWVNSSHQVAKVLEFQLQHQSFQWTPRTDLL